MGNETGPVSRANVWAAVCAGALLGVAGWGAAVRGYGAEAEGEGEGAKDKPPQLEAGTLSAFKLRSLGPALMSGRISDLALDPVEPNTWYVAVGSGNVWKTTNAGTTWEAIFENYNSYSIGCVTVDPGHRHTVWVGTGEAVGGRHVGYGDGVYRSLDGGRSFKNVGLTNTHHIARILIDPRDSRTVYVAAQGPLWSGGGERGLYKSGDGGQTWTQVLARGPYTGVTDVVMDPKNPDVLYAATHQRHRTVWALINGGPESGVWKTTDAGRSWRELKSGLPGGDKGKIALGISPQQPEVVYASIELPGRKGGFWRSANGGETWTKMSDFISGGTGPHYYQELFCDPHRFDVLYQVDVQLARTEDGGRTWVRTESPWKHVDNHAVAFHPRDSDFLLVGCDGGLYRSFDRGQTYTFFPNLPLTQFYKVDVDYAEPFYHVMGGTQDNATQHGPARTRSVSGIRNSDWRVLIGGDGHDCAADPKDPNVIYCESQEGYLRRHDRRTGESVDIRPIPEKGEEALRFNWDSPILISPHLHTRVYFGSKRLHRSDDRGESWTTVSPDLSRGRDRYALPLMDRVWSIDATWDVLAMSQYGNISCLSESPLQEGLIYVGTDDGLLQVTEDGGKNWRRVERIYGIPEFAFVNDVKADLHRADTVYALFDNHKEGDLKPYLVRSDDRGRTWTPMTGDLPDRHLLWRLVQDHVRSDLFFLGTEFGVFTSFNSGTNWIKLTGGVPTIPFRDLEIQRRENDLVGATFGRGFYVLDDYAPLRSLSVEMLKTNDFALFPVRRAWLYVPERPLGGEKGSQGDSYFTAANPPFGAVFTCYLKAPFKTLRQERQEKEGKARKGGGDNLYPGWDELKREEQEERPALWFTVQDEAGKVVARVPGPTSAGFHRVDWDLQYSTAEGRGPRVTPGKYTVRAEKRYKESHAPLGEPQTFEVVAAGEPALPVQDRGQTLAFQQQAGELMRAVRGTTAKLDEVLGQVVAVKEAVRRTVTAEEALFESARKLELRLLAAKESLLGDPIKPRFEVSTVPSVMQRVGYALGSMSSTHGPTQTQRRSYQIAVEEYGAAREVIRECVEVAWPELQRQAEAAGLPWTPGRALPEVRP